MKLMIMLLSLIVSASPAIAKDWAKTGVPYVVTTEALACNVSPQPCYDSSCQVVIIPEGSTFIALDVMNQIDSFKYKPWFYTDYDCYVRANSDYIARIPSYYGFN